MLKNLFNKLKNKVANLGTDKTEKAETTRYKHEKIKVFAPNGLVPYFFPANVCIVAQNERQARNQYEAIIKKALKNKNIQGKKIE